MLQSQDAISKPKSMAPVGVPPPYFVKIYIIIRMILLRQTNITETKLLVVKLMTSGLYAQSSVHSR